jgi:hypothetical protein
VLEPLGLLVDLVPGDPENVGEEALDQPVTVDDLRCLLVPVLGEGERLVAGPLDVAVVLEATDHLVHGRRRELHRAGDVGAGDRQPGLIQPEHRLQVLLLRDCRLIGGHGAMLAVAKPPPAMARRY